MATMEKLYHSGHSGTQGKPYNIFPSVLCAPLRSLRFRFCSFSENSRTYTHAGCSLFYCYLEIVRHAHGKNRSTDFRQPTRGDPVANLAELAKVEARPLRIFRVRRNGHQAANFQIPPSRRALQNQIQFVRTLFVRARRDPGFGQLAANIDLDQDGQYSARAFRRRIQLFRHPRGVNGINRGKQFDCLRGLVRLQMSDQVPRGVRQIAQGSRLSGELLHPALAKHAQPGRVRFVDALRRESLAHAHQRDFGRIAARPLRRRRDLLLHLGNIFRNRH